VKSFNALTFSILQQGRFKQKIDETIYGQAFIRNLSVKSASSVSSVIQDKTAQTQDL
jgi:hypothetical protein